MSLPISVTYTFATATSSIPLSQLDANFTTVVNGINGIGNGTNALANVNITGGNATVSSLTSPTLNSSTTLSLKTGGTTGLYIDGSQNVGIGTTSPGVKLDVAGSIRGNNNIYTADGAGYGWGSLSAYVGGSSASNFINFTTNSSECMRITPNGDLLIGTTNDYGKLEVLNNTNNSGIRIDQITSSTNWTAFFCNVQNSGNNLVTWAYQGVTVGTVITNGSTTAYNTSSDYRLKTNVTPLTTAQSGPIIDALKPSQFTWTTDNTTDVGFIAHEMQAVIPRAVNGEKDAVDAEGKPVYQQIAVSSPEIIAYLVAELQSVRQRLAATETEIATLKTKVGA
jgi:Chaperone of endosialidase